MHRKSPDKQKAEVTAFLSLIFLLLVSFTGMIMESASLQMAKSYRRADACRALESVFAEFQRELLEEFHVFGLDGGYESGAYSERQVMDRYSYYGASGMENRILRIQFLSDQKGEAFREQAITYMMQKYGLDTGEGIFSESSNWQQQKEESGGLQRLDEQTQGELDQMLVDNETELPVRDNPLPNIARLKREPLLSLVMPKEKPVSQKQLVLTDTVSGRARNEGFGTFEDVAGTPPFSRVMFGSYLLEHFICAVPEDGSTKSAGTLDYELEYILNGDGNDSKNLEAVARKLLMLRFAPNYGYLLTDSGKQAEAEALALTLSTAAGFPPAAGAVKQILLLGWAFGECIMDIRSLLAGSKVPLIKSTDSWQLSISHLLTLGQAEDNIEGADSEGGLTYREYLRILLFLEGEDEIALRGLDMAEQRLRLQKGLTWFRADACISKIEIESTCRLRRGISYQFRTYYGYR